MNTPGVASASRRASASAWWLLAFPATYLVHIAEEYWSGETFWRWASRMSGADFSHRDFVVLNAIAFGAMTVAALAARRLPRVRAVAVPAMATVVAVNGALHGVAALVTGTHSPGMVSGLVLWLPLGLWALRRALRDAGRLDAGMAAGIALGVAAQAMVSVIAFQ